MPARTRAVRVVVVTSDDDYTADMVVRGLPRETFVRLDPGRLRPGTILNAPAPDGPCLVDNRVVPPGAAVWWRKPTPARDLTGDRAWAADETTSLLEGMLHNATAAGHWMNTPAAVARIRPKPVQLELAHQVGLAVPDTLVTTDAQEASAFIAGGPTVVKPTTQRFTDFAPVFRITPGDDLAGIGGALCLLQREVTPKTADWRVTLVGDEVFACRITEAELDWRTRPNDCRYSAEDLDDSTADRLRRYRLRAGLNLIAFDLAESADGTLWFLDANANPEFGFQEIATRAPITATLARWLQGDDRT
ncbi:hypothetical protein [Yinghuangia sp. YIM S09857]|uniref:hypothetical protein n=1 Tax=Yinghuangia sp. YIM S09857 TaxID=3436929 RepID=UPI003F53CBC6